MPIINAVFTPSADEIAAARQVVEAAAAGAGALRLTNGDFVDVAVVRRAADLLRLAEALLPGGAA